LALRVKNEPWRMRAAILRVGFDLQAGHLYRLTGILATLELFSIYIAVVAHFAFFVVQSKPLPPAAAPGERRLLPWIPEPS
jgi:hypothetical protein